MFNNFKEIIFQKLPAEGIKKYFFNTSWLLLEKLLRIISSVLVGVWVARYLGPEDYGFFNYSQSLVLIFGTFATLGMDRVITKHLIENPEDKNRYLGTAFIIKLVSSFSVVLILYIFLLLSNKDSFEILFVFIISSSLIFQSFNVIDLFFQSTIQNKYILIANIVSLVTSSFVKFWLVVSNAPLISFSFTIALDTFILVLTFLYLYEKSGNRVKEWEFDWRIGKGLIVQSWPLILAAALNTLYMRIDQVMIQSISGNREVGLYSSAIKLSEVWYSMGIVICNSVFPSIINSKKVSKDFYYKRLSFLFILLNGLSFVFALGMLFSSHYLIELLFGVDYMDAAVILRIHAFSSIFVFQGIASGRWLIAEGWNKYDLYRNLIGVAINVSLNFYFIPIYGGIGAAFTSLASYFVAFFLIDLISSRSRRLFWIKLKSFLFIK
ncbi:Membrane protein involved in the export of O-antigen and teichoic acid [Reichenbachiella agariperforans]|uniref:Membrane protein involved in the export of O-antigen and teichoic acid n=1 Tax=Reichenbachiella agariperforans TaxID=156994 RepID=A0A1M6NUZ3_REIAG|nr:flippase [Reichenbachiella agariperforans]SHJ99471.1 Membrane protein involved in the export of O-antigen and teichoic acid [Reichenbachiella agariperforans]